MHFDKEKSFNWLFSQDITEVKEISRVVLASHLWDVKNELIVKLIRAKGERFWNYSLRDSSRAVSALANRGIIFPDVEKWILSKQENSSWNNDVYDTTYALAALADMGIYNPEGCSWLVENYSSDWEYPGTTALIISALIRQNEIQGAETTNYKDFINERARYILSQRDKNGAWKTIATSNICIQALLLAGCKKELSDDIDWLLGKMNANGVWGKDEGNVTATALSLITLAYFNE
ncbi:hypothetical protein V7O66_08655 [Methanolobus sp. ZRKC3]|uniref:hypothetical protein n=1 Tax=Methanolobus sp. ZRKC3 TaxID=3125786 RepID=UPI003248F17C